MVILVMGLPGSGKSYFASRLAEALGADYFNSDRIRKEMITRRNYSEQEKERVYDEMLLRMEKSIKQNKDTILDATFYRKKIRRKFSSKIPRSVNMAIIEVTASEPVIQKRLSRTREFSEADFEVYQAIQKEWEPIVEKHLVLISRDDNPDDMLQKAIQYLHLIKHEQGTGRSIDSGGGNSRSAGGKTTD